MTLSSFFRVSPPVCGGEEDIFEAPERGVRSQRFGRGHVDAGPGDCLALHGVDQRDLVDTAAAGQR